MTLITAVVGEQRYCLLFTLMKSFIVNCIETNSENWSALSEVIIKKVKQDILCVCLEVVDACWNFCTFRPMYKTLQSCSFFNAKRVCCLFLFPIVSYVLSNCRCYRHGSWWRLKASEVHWLKHWMYRKVDFSWNFLIMLSVDERVNSSRFLTSFALLLLCWFTILYRASCILLCFCLSVIAVWVHSLFFVTAKMSKLLSRCLLVNLAMKYVPLRMTL